MYSNIETVKIFTMLNALKILCIALHYCTEHNGAKNFHEKNIFQHYNLYLYNNGIVWIFLYTSIIFIKQHMGFFLYIVVVQLCSDGCGVFGSDQISLPLTL